jgi:hypothetical protein
MNLVGQHHGVESMVGSTKRSPPTHHLADRGVGPQAEVEAATRLRAAAGDAGDDAV